MVYGFVMDLTSMMHCAVQQIWFAAELIYKVHITILKFGATTFTPAVPEGNRLAILPCPCRNS